MNKRIISICIAISLVSALQVRAQSGSLFVQGNASYVFDNHEFAPSKDYYQPSRTIHFVSLVPQVGYAFEAGDLKQKFVLGMDLTHFMGSGVIASVEVPLYYNADYSFENGRFEGYAGVYPASACEQWYGEAVIADYVRELDRYWEGMMLKYRRSSFSTELALDWNGMKFLERREEFRIFSAGSWKSGRFTLGWAARMHHYANSDITVRNVVDDHVFEPFVSFRAVDRSNASLDLKLGYIQSYQKDRNKDVLFTPMGAEFIVDGHWKAWFMRNTFALSDNLAPFFYKTDTAGQMYGYSLYTSSRMYHDEGYDLLEFGYAPRISERTSLEVKCRFHTGFDGYRGCQQVVTLKIDLN